MRRLITILAIAVGSAPALAQLPKVEATFTFDSPNVFPDSLLGAQKPGLEEDGLSALLAQLQVHFPFVDWQAPDSADPADHQLALTVVDGEEHGFCGWSVDLLLSTVSSGNDSVPLLTKPLYGACDDLPITFDPEIGSLADFARNQLMDKLRVVLADEGEARLLDKEGLVDKLLSEVQLAEKVDITQVGQESRLSVPIPFRQLGLSRKPCSANEGDPGCSKLIVEAQLEQGFSADFVLRIDGICEGNVVSQILSASSNRSGYSITEPIWFDEAIRDDLENAQSWKINIGQFTPDSNACPSTINDALDEL